MLSTFYVVCKGSNLREFVKKNVTCVVVHLELKTEPLHVVRPDMGDMEY